MLGFYVFSKNLHLLQRQLIFIERETWAAVVSRLLKWAGRSVTFEQILPSSLRERGAHRLKIKTSTVISCSSGCFTKKTRDMNCIFHPLQSWLLRARPFSGLHVSWWSQEQATKEAELEGCRSAVCCICVSHCSNQIQKGEAWLNPFYLLVRFLCVCAHSRVHVPPFTCICLCLFLCVLVYWWVSECGCWCV